MIKFTLVGITKKTQIYRNEFLPGEMFTVYLIDCMRWKLLGEFL